MLQRRGCNAKIKQSNRIEFIAGAWYNNILWMQKGENTNAKG